MPITKPKPKPKPPRFAIVLESKPDASDPSGHRRLRMAIKTLGRQFGLVCKSVLPEQAAPNALPETADSETLTRPHKFDSVND